MAAQGEFREAYLDWSGGINAGQDPSVIGETESAVLRNIYAYGRKLVRRPGLQYLDDTGVAIVSLGRYVPTDGGPPVTIWAGATSLGQVHSGVSLVLGSGYASSDQPWSLLQYKGVHYACRRGVGLLRAVPPGPYLAAGIAGPASAPTVADGAAGDIEAGTYGCVYRFRNSVTDQPSNPSPVSSMAATGAKKIAWSLLEVSTDPQVDTRDFFRSLKDQPGIYYYVGSDSNVGTTFTENVLTDEMGDAATWTHDRPGDLNLQQVVEWGERFWGHDGKRLYFSEFGLPESWDELSLVEVGPDDGYDIVQLIPAPGRLFVVKERGIWFMTGEDPTNLTKTLFAPKHGAGSPQSYTWVDGWLYWYDDAEIYRSQGDEPEPIGTPRIKPWLDGINPLRHHLVVSTSWEALGWVLFSIPYEVTSDPGHTLYTTNTRTLVWSYRHNAWVGEFVWTHRSTLHGVALTLAPNCFTVLQDFNRREFLAAAFPGKTYVYDLLADRDMDHDEPRTNETINWEWKGRSYAGPEKRIVQRCHMNNENVADDEIAASLVLDDGAAEKYRSVQLAQGAKAWRPIALSTRRRAATSIQPRLYGDSSKRFEIYGWALDGMVLSGRIGRVA